MLELSNVMVGTVLVAGLSVGALRAQTTPAKMVQMPADIACGGAFNATTSIHSDGTVTMVGGSVQGFGCKIANGTKKIIALSSSALQDGAIQTTNFGVIRVVGSFPTGGITNPSELSVELKYSISEDEIKSLRAFLGAE